MIIVSSQFSTAILHRSKQLRFTLIELLMVIVIIMIIAAMLFPAMSTSREKAYRTVCANNLKQIGIASYNYSEEFDHYIMPGKFGDTSTDGNYNHWINYMYSELLPDKSVFQCPSMGKVDYFNPAGGSNEITEASYIRNLIESGKWDGANISTDPEGSWGWSSPTKYIKDQAVINPSEKLNIMDVAAGGIHFNHAGILNFQETDYGLINSKPLAGYRRVGYHHSLGFNALMGDAHTEYIRQSAPNQWVVISE